MKTNNGIVVLLNYPADTPRVFGPFQSHEEARTVLATMDVAIPEGASLVTGRTQPLGAALVDEGIGMPDSFSWGLLEDPRLIFG